MAPLFLSTSLPFHLCASLFMVLDTLAVQLVIPYSWPFSLGLVAVLCFHYVAHFSPNTEYSIAFPRRAPVYLSFQITLLLPSLDLAVSLELMPFHTPISCPSSPILEFFIPHASWITSEFFLASSTCLILVEFLAILFPSQVFHLLLTWHGSWLSPNALLFFSFFFFSLRPL